MAVMFNRRSTSSEPWSERLLAVLVIAIVLAGVDQLIKLQVATPSWAVHQRSGLWFAASCVLLIGVMPLTRVPSRAVALAAGVFAGGVLGNLLSAGFDGLSVPNPIIIMHMGGIAFNPADAFIMSGNLALMTTLSCVVLRYRNELKAWRAMRRDSILQRLTTRSFSS